MNPSYYINSIYLATEGEGCFIGTPQVFVRYQGCAIACHNCDSKETWHFKRGGQSYELSELLNLIEHRANKVRRVSITGGDPLHESFIPGLVELVKALKTRGYFVNIEAAGTKVVPSVFELVDFISFDYKTPSTGVETPVQNIVALAKNFPNKFQIKSVIESRADFDATFEAYQKVNSEISGMPFFWCLTPSYNTGEEFPQQRFQTIIDWNHSMGGPFRVIGQQHKWIFGPDKKQV